MPAPCVQSLILGLGHPILTDDGVGIYVARAVASHLALHGSLSGVSFAEAIVSGRACWWRSPTTTGSS